MKILLAVLCTICAVYGKSLPEGPEEDNGEDMSATDIIFNVNQYAGKTDESISTFGAGSDSNPDLFEGDIVMTNRLKSQINQMNHSNGNDKFDAIRNGAWPKGVVPYTFASNFARTYRSAVMSAIKEYNAKTCIRWKPYTAALARAAGGYVQFFHSGGCYSMIGRQGGLQKISLGTGCGTKGVAIHEMMHALGFFHEQSRRDRDSYIRINWNNINPSTRYNFEKYRSGQASTLGEPYDKSSIMHYGNYAFSINRQKTIVSISNYNEVLGQRNGLSVIDARQLNKYYKCSNTGTGVVKPPVVTNNLTNKYKFCVDLSKWCGDSFVKANCKKTCGCKDIKTQKECSYWSNQGFCRHTWVTFMKVNCPKTCNMC